MEVKTKKERCIDCGSFGKHSLECKNLTFQRAIELAKNYREDFEMAWSKKEEARRDITFWQGKFHMVRQENNKLRRKVYQQTRTEKVKHAANCSIHTNGCYICNCGLFDKRMLKEDGKGPINNIIKELKGEK